MKSQRNRLGWFTGAALALATGGNAAALDVGVFGDMSLSHSSVSTSEPSFRLGSLDLYAAQYIDDHTRALFEVQFQTFAGDTMEIEIQRFWIMREVSDEFHIGIGRFHTPIGYWNRHFHHGILLQDTVTRPFILSFEGSVNAIIPTHLIGILAEGDLPWGLRYEAAVANSNTINSTAAGDRLTVPNRADLSAEKSLFGRLHYGRFGAPLKPGVFFMKNDVLESAAAGAELCGDPPVGSCSLVTRGEPLVRQMLYGVDFRYERGRFDIMAEYYRIQNDARPGVGDGRKHDSDAWFAQFGYRITDQLKATYRYEALDFDSEPGNQDPYYLDPRMIGKHNIGTEHRNVYALRYDFSESNAIMLEVNLRDTQFGERSTTTYLSWAFVMY
jgi:hypothetical protein